MEQKKEGFTLLELVFVIVVMGIIAKFGMEFFAQAYRNYLYQKISNELQNSSSAAVEFIAKKLHYRVKNSVIVRDSSNSDWKNNFEALEGNDSADGYDVLEWIAYDIESFRGGDNGTPMWSAIIDREYAHATPIPTDVYSPGTNTTKIDNMIKILSGGGSDIDDAAIYVMSSENDIYTDYGWDGDAITDQNHSMHPINDDTNKSKYISGNSDDFVVLNEDLDDARYKLAWTAYAVEYDTSTGNLKFYYDYQPWNGEKYTDGKSVLIMENVSTFKKRQSFNIMKIQICTKSDFVKRSDSDEEQYSVCKEKTIY